MSKERWFRADRDGRERQRESWELAEAYGIAESDVTELYQEAVSPAPGKVSRTMRLTGVAASSGWRTVDGQAAVSSAPAGQGPSAAMLVEQARLYLSSAKRDALDVLEAAAARADDLAAERAWSSARSYVGLVEQCLKDAEDSTRTDSEATAIASQVSALRAASAQLSGHGSRLVAGLQLARSKVTPARSEDPVATAPPAVRPRGAASEVPYRAEMEAAFGRSFRGVIAYTGAEEASDALAARAYAVGETVVFASPSPDRETVAHELTHVLQHRAARRSSATGATGVSRPGDAAETEADQMAAQVAAGQAIRQPITAVPAAAIHRRPSRPNEVFELGIEHKINRVSLSLRVKASMKDPRIGVGETTAGENTHVKAGAEENKASLKRGGGKWSGQLASALLRLDVTDDDIQVPGFPFLTVKADLKVLEGKVANLSGGDFDLDILKVGIAVEGNVPVESFAPDLASHGIEWEVKVAGRGEVPLTAEDLARLAQLVRSSGKVTRATAQIASARKTLARLEKEQTRLNRLLKGRTGKARTSLARRLAVNRAAITRTGRRLSRSRNTLNAASLAFRKAASGLKKGAGKLASKALIKATSKLLARFGAALIPGLNLASFAYDVFEICRALYEASQRKDGNGGGGGDGGKDGDDTAAGGAGNVAESDDAGETGADDDAGDDADIGEGEADAERDASEEDAGVLDGGEEAPVELHPGARAVLQLIEGVDGEPLDDAGHEMLNDLVPRDLTADEVERFRERLEATPHRSGGDAFATVGAIREEIERIREGDPPSSLVIDGTKYVDTPDGGVDVAPVKGKTGSGKNEDSGGGSPDSKQQTIDDSQLFRPGTADLREGLAWDPASGKLSIKNSWLVSIKKLRTPSSEGGTARVTGFVIDSQRDAGAAGQPFIEYTIAITVEIDVKGGVAPHTERYTFFYDPKQGGHAMEGGADLVAAFHSVLEFGDGGVAIRGKGIHEGKQLRFSIQAVTWEASLGVAVVKVQFTRGPARVRTPAGWLSPSPNQSISVHVPPPDKASP